MGRVVGLGFDTKGNVSLLGEEMSGSQEGLRSLELVS